MHPQPLPRREAERGEGPTAQALSPGARRYVVRAGLWFVFGRILCTVVVLLVPALVPPETASNFFLAASGVNATPLVAIAITISSIVRRGSETSRQPRLVLFVAQLSIVFVGMIASGFGILLSTLPPRSTPGRSWPWPGSSS